MEALPPPTFGTWTAGPGRPQAAEAAGAEQRLRVLAVENRGADAPSRDGGRKRTLRHRSAVAKAC